MLFFNYPNSRFEDNNKMQIKIPYSLEESSINIIIDQSYSIDSLVV